MKFTANAPKMSGTLPEHRIKNIMDILVTGSIVSDTKCHVGISKLKNIRNRINNE